VAYDEGKEESFGRNQRGLMPTSALFGKVLFLLCLILLGWTVLAPKPQSRFGRRSSILVAATLVLLNLRSVTALSDGVENAVALVGLLLVVAAVVGRA